MNEPLKELQLKIERLEKEINFKNGLISILSHDSKELFGNLVWLIEAVENKSISEDEFFKILPQIKRDAQKNLQSVQDSTTWLKTQSENFQIKSVKIMVVELFHHLKEKYAEKLNAKKIQFYFKGDIDAFVETDHFLLEYILDKMLDNAVKYALPGQDIYFQEVTEEHQTILSIIDFGTGMNENYLSTIFSYDNPVFIGTAGEKGAGLSLKIVKNFISLMHGDIKIISAENKGTTVSLFLPKFKG